MKGLKPRRPPIKFQLKPVKIQRGNKRKLICRDLEGNKYIVTTDKLVFRPSVYGVIINDDKVLLSKQWDGYDFPGGGIELGETIKEALVREVKEETGLEVAMGQILAVEDSFFKLPISGKFVHSILLYYLCSIIGGRLSIELLSGEEKGYLERPEWLDIVNIHSIKFYNSVDSLAIIRKAKEMSAALTEERL